MKALFLFGITTALHVGFIALESSSVQAQGSNQPRSIPEVSSTSAAETADRTMRIFVDRIGAAAGEAFACGFDRIASEFSNRANNFILQYSVRLVIDGRPVNWQRPFEDGFRSGRSLALQTGCRSEPWTSEWKDIMAEAARTLPRRSDDERGWFQEREFRFVFLSYGLMP